MRVNPFAAAMIATGTAGAAGLGYAWLEARAFALREYTLPVLPPGSPSLRVLHVSDIHLVPRQQRKAAWVHRLGELEPDLVVSTGDTIAGTDAVPAALAAHGPLLDRPGVFVLGSNDYYAPRVKNPARYLLPEGGKRRITGRPLPTDDLVKGFLHAGWLDLDNERGSLTVKGLRLDFVGVDDPHLQRDRYARVSRPADPAAALTVGVTHAPYLRVLDAMTDDGAALILAGHTHGGQLCLPGFGALVTNCDLDRGRAKGVSRWPSRSAARRPAGRGAEQEAAQGPGGSWWGAGGLRRPRTDRLGPGTREEAVDGAWLHVSAGIGTSPFTPVRFACRPEASLLTLVPREGSGS